MRRVSIISSHLILSLESDQHCTCFDSEVHGVPPSQPLLRLHVHHYAFGRELRLDTKVVDKREGERGRWIQGVEYLHQGERDMVI